MSPTHNPPTLEIAADSINATTVPQHINVQPTGPPTHVNHGFQISKSAPTTTTNTTSSYPRYHYQTAPRSGSTSSQAGPPPPEHYFVAYPQQQLQQQQLQQQQQQQQQLQQLQQQASMPIQTSPPPPPSASIQNHNQVVAGPGYYIVQHPQLIPLPPTAPHLQGQTYHSLPAHPLHNQAPLSNHNKGSMNKCITIRIEYLTLRVLWLVLHRHLQCMRTTCLIVTKTMPLLTNVKL